MKRCISSWYVPYKPIDAAAAAGKAAAANGMPNGVASPCLSIRLSDFSDGISLDNPSFVSAKNKTIVHYS